MANRFLWCVRVRLREFAARVRAVVEALSLERGVHVTVDCDQEDQQLLVELPDELALQMVLNFASNAVRCAASYVGVTLCV